MRCILQAPMNETPNDDTTQEIRQLLSLLVSEVDRKNSPSSSNTENNASTSPTSSTRFPSSPTEPRKPLQSILNEIKPTYEIYRAAAAHFDSRSDLDVHRHALPPSYSSVIKQGRPSLDIRRDVRSLELERIRPLVRVPPPSYSEIQTAASRDFSHSSSEQILLGPDPIYIWCTRCSNVVITVTDSQRTRFTHFTAMALCLFGCWPCALMPYCMHSCKNIYHYCPDCNYLFGMYRPW